MTDKRLSRQISFWINTTLSGIAASAAAISAILGQCSLQETQKQVRVAQNGQRAFVGVPAVQIENETVMFVLENRGKEPTRGLDMRFRIVSGDAELQIREAKKACEAPQKNMSDSNKAFSLIPGERWPIQSQFAGPNISPAADREYKLSGCIVYGINYESDYKHTAFFGTIQIEGRAITAQNLYAAYAN